MNKRFNSKNCDIKNKDELILFKKWDKMENLESNLQIN